MFSLVVNDFYVPLKKSLHISQEHEDILYFLLAFFFFCFTFHIYIQPELVLLYYEAEVKAHCLPYGYQLIHQGMFVFTPKMKSQRHSLLERWE